MDDKRYSRSFYNANEAFVELFYYINRYGLETGNGTKTFNNVGFYLENPLDNKINVEWRNWSNTYAEREWVWYVSRSRSVKDLKKYAPIWDKMHSGDDIVNSNYGHLWHKNNQLTKCINQLKEDPTSRRAWLTLFDGKDKDQYEYDTPCTLNIGFCIIDDRLCMNVQMRSNDLYYGFCNDQYCFSKLQEMVAKALKLEVGWYYHFAANLHIYESEYNKNAV